MKKLLLAGLVALFVFPSFTMAQVAPTADADVDTVEQQSSCINISNNLRYRMRDATVNNEVSDLQDFLNISGYLKSGPTGYFGLATFNAVKKFQSASGFAPTGYVGPLTRAKISALTCGGIDMTPPAKLQTITPVAIPSQTQVATTPATSPSLPAGCTSAVGYSSLTGSRCLVPATPAPTNLPAGCASTAGFSFVTGAPCSSSSAEYYEEVRLKGADAAIKSTLSNIRAIAELYYDSHGNYMGVCNDNSGSNNVSKSKSLLIGYKAEEIVCRDSAEKYAMSARLASPNVGYWCIDSTGVSKQTTATLPIGQFSCSGSTIAPAPTVSLTAYPTTIALGQSSTLTLSSANAEGGCSGVLVTDGKTFGTTTVSPTQTTSYGVTCYELPYNGGRSASTKVTVSVVPATTPTITVVSPNGWEQIQEGSTQLIKWSTKNFSGLNVTIDLIDSTGYIVTNIASNISNTGYYYWNTAAGVKGGYMSGYSYKILISSNDKGPSAQDYSDSYFSIAATITTAPNILSISPNPATPDQTIMIIGSNLNLSANKVVASGNAYDASFVRIGTGVISSTQLSTTPRALGLTSAGVYPIKIGNSLTGDSNTVYLTVGMTTASAPTVEFIGARTTSLIYDSVGKESMLVGDATVKITAGNSSILVYNIPHLFQIMSGQNLVMTNSTQFTARNTSGTTVVGNPLVPAGASSVFTIHNTIPTKELFAGTYLAAPRGDIFMYCDQNGSNCVYPSLASFVNANTSLGSPVTIVGETSPYISSVVVDPIPAAASAGYYDIYGNRFHSTLNQVSVNGITKTLPSSYVGPSPTGLSTGPSDNGGLIMLKLSDFNIIASGVYSLQVSTPEGASNNFNVNVTVANSPTVTVLSPNGGETITAGKIYPLKWIIRNYPTEKGGLAEVILRNVNTGVEASITSAGIDNNNESWINWTVPTSVVPGSYDIRIYVVSNAKDLIIKDVSDAPFSIVAAGVNLPDLIISDFTWTPISPKSGENITANVKVKNIGLSSAQNFSVTNLWDGNYKEINLSNLAPGGETTVQGNIGGLSIPGANNMSMMVDAPSKVVESNENNNSLAKTITVSQNYSGDGTFTLKHWETLQLNNGYILYADGENILEQTPYKVRFKLYTPSTTSNYQVVATSPDLNIGSSSLFSSQGVSVKVNAINVSSPGNANWSVDLTASSTTTQPTLAAQSTQLASLIGAFTQTPAPTPASAPAPTWAYSWTRNLEVNSPYTDDVSALQMALTKEGVFSGEVSGGFYTQTYLAVKAFQAKYGIESTGFVGPITLAKFNELY